MSKLAEILSSYVEKFLDSRRVDQDAEVLRHVVQVIVALQDLSVTGEALLTLTEQLLDNPESPDTATAFVTTLTKQSDNLVELQDILEASQSLLATVDAGFYPDLALLVDRKSGLLTRWRRQAELFEFSTTTLFFLPARELARLVEAGRAVAGPDGLPVQRDEYVIAVADSIRGVRAREVVDIRRAADAAEDRIRSEIATARADVIRAKDSCAALHSAAASALGPDALARLRRKLVR